MKYIAYWLYDPKDNDVIVEKIKNRKVHTL